MALDGIYLFSLWKELSDELIGGRVDKINQPEKDEVILTIKKDRRNVKLLISASSNYPRIHITNFNKQNPITAPMFCMVLRKHLNTAKIINIRQISTDRIIIIDFESSDELGFNSVYSLIIEIMGRHSNITLVRERDNVVIDSIKHITPDINSYRVLYSGTQYVYPPKSTKLDPFNFTIEEFQKYTQENNIDLYEDINSFSKIFTGVSSPLSKEIHFIIKKNAVSYTSYIKVYETILNLFNKIKNYEFSFNSYSKNNLLKEFYCLELYTFKDYSKTTYNSPSVLLENYYFEKDKSDRLHSKSSDLQKMVHNNLDRCTKKLKILENTLKECEGKEKYSLMGELLTANIYSLKKGENKITLLNYYNNENININLDRNKTPSENIQTYYKKYNKLKRSEEASTEQLNLVKEEIEYIQSVLTNIKNADSYEEITEIRKELIQSGYIKIKKNDKSNKKQKSPKPLHFISSDGLDIYVGKNNIQNDYLTLKFASKKDIWLHTKNIPGSHVIIKNPGKVPDKTLEEAATLAVLYSKGSESTKVPVDYTEVKHVKKPTGAKPGKVIYYTNNTIYITPEKLNLEKVKD